ncbi:ABC transporter permease subunit [Savagea sp. SN6]|uniref:ABC transporter permease subunit n=1 Tax=Savagea serpentis TaxID=2785297 RepID=A0A8J7KLZ0_9BACL|nr:ABC transporter permease subunit [Savagea serpentis]MBF4501934.1 ABC transporter permease subunit [Savagea serpentis]
MFVIATKEFLEMMKSFKALLVIALLVLSSYFASSFIASAPAEFMMGTDAYTAVIRLFLLGFGFVFVLMLSHDVMSREVASGTMRLLITKTSRIAIIGGKFLGIAAFWLFSLGVSLAIISFFAKELPWLAFLQLYSFLLFIIGLCLLLSTLAKSPNVSLLIGLAVSFIAPIIGIWSTFSDKAWLQPFKYILPYRYQTAENVSLFVPVLFGIGFLTLATFLFKRGDY